MVDNRAAILAGVKAAHTLHRDLGVRESIERAGGSRIDVFGAITKLGAALMFQPLDKLLGAYLPEEELGVLITTKRALRVQRFTAAHELGHLCMKHSPSFDDAGILRRAPFSASSRVERQEREADAFASMFLVPAWLLALLMHHQGWTRHALDDPLTAYQASLRLGTSYRATCYALERHKVISRSQCATLVDVEPQTLKRALINDYEPPDWHRDVWLLTDRDEGSFIEGGRNDLFVVKLRENSGAGYLWNFDQLKNAGFAVVGDGREDGGNAECVGGVLTRMLIARSEDRTQGEVTFQQRRPWLTQEPLSEYHLRYDLRGPERAGMWEPELQRLLQATQ